MRIAIGLYLIAFAAIGVWSVATEGARTPLLERIGEAIAFVVLSFGMLLFLLERAVPGGPVVWLTATLGACAVELVVILHDRRRTIREELVKTGESEEPQRLFRAADLATLGFFLPAIVINVKYAVGWVNDLASAATGGTPAP